MAAVNTAHAPVNDRCGHCRGIVRCSTCGRPPAATSSDTPLCEHCGNPLSRHPISFRTKSFGTLTCSGTADVDTPAIARKPYPRNYQPKPCRLCTTTFTPTGPRDNDCLACKAKRA